MPRRRTFTPGRINQKRSRKATSTFANSVMGVGTDIKSLPTDRLMAQEREDNPVFHSQRKLGGSIGGPEIPPVPPAPSPLFYWKGQYSLAATTGTDPTFTRATAATFEDFEGLIKTVESSEPRFQGARRVENELAGSGDGSWSATPTGSSNINLVTGVSDPDGGTNAIRITATGGAYFYTRLSAGIGKVANNSCWVRLVNNPGGVIGMYDAAQAGINITATISTSWQRMATDATLSHANGSIFGFNIGGPTPTGTSIEIYQPQIEFVTGQTNQNPSEYVSTGVGTGPELVTNGDFSNGTTGWAPFSDAVLSVVSGRLRITSPTTFDGAFQSFPTTIGKTYSLSYSVFKGTASTYRVELGFGPAQVNNYASGAITAASQIKTVSWVATHATTYITIRCDNAGTYIEADNISVKEASHGANVDGVQYFNTLNANTVTSNVVTEAVGSPLTRANTQFGELNGVTNNDYFSTPNVVTTWDGLDIRVRAVVRETPDLIDFFLSKDGGGTNRSFFLGTVYGNLYILYYDSIANVSYATQSNAPNPIAYGEIGWFRTTVETTTGDIKFFTADGSLEAPAISDYVQLGTTINLAGGATTINATTIPFRVGSWGASGGYPINASFYRAQVFNTVDGTTPVVDFTAGSYVSGSTLVSSTSGETWTLNGNASVFQPPVDASGPFGYLAEKASTNLALQSENFTTSWTPQGATIVTDVAVAPDGTTTMDRMAVAFSSTNVQHDVYNYFVNPAGTLITCSVYMKDDGAGFGGMCIGNGDGVSVVVDLSTGLVTDTEIGIGAGVAITATGCEDAGNGIYRVWISGTTSSSNCYIIPFASNAAVPPIWVNGRPSYQGVLGEDILVWGAQVELGTYPTSYIPTTTTAVTRNADVLIAGDMVTDAAGSGYSEASTIWQAGGNTYLLARNYPNLILYVGAGASNSGSIGTWNGVSSSGSSGTYMYNAPQSLASTWGNNLTAYYNGIPDATPATYSGTFGTGNLGIGSNNTGANTWNGTIREVKIFDSELTAAEVGDL